ncbi:MAG: SDR family oxidoreductase [Holophagales bacterium]|nr:SDR family oxidoreductase [Holophagales bacterium]MYF04700.1 SDR family oxidoreductase [Holophagales bacterium]MYJ26068.1 SDR family oxidoreductase [Holophagales bacterium]
MKDLFDLTGRVSVITGSTKGIGKAMAEALAAFGSKVVISSRKADACEAVAAAINESGGEAIAHPCHVGHKDQLERLVAATRERWGKIDNLVVNAAVNPYYGSSLGIPDSAFDKVMEVNIRSVHWLCQLVIPEMQERKDGSIVIVSSVGGFRGNAVLGAYAISKAADMQLARNLAAEFGPDNIRVNAVCPGLVKTDFARALWEDPQREQAVAGRTPLRRLGEPVDCAGIAVYLASRAGSWTTGQTFTVDGGVLGCG